MELFTELILRNILANFVGLNTRYWVFKFLRIKKSKEYLSGEDNNDKTNSISQGFLNGIVGVIVIVLISFLVAWLVYS